MIQLKNISYSVENKCVLKNLNAEFSGKGLHLISGSNGAGKTTLLRIIAKLLVPSRGKVLFQKQDFQKQDLSKMDLPSLAKQRAFLPQHHGLNFNLSGLELLETGLYPFKLKEKDALLKTVVKALGLKPFLDKKYLSLSGGEKQILQLGRVFVQAKAIGDGAIVLLDEPFNFLDEKHKSLLLKKLQEEKDVCFILVSHNPDLLKKYACSHMKLQGGCLIGC